MSEGEEKVIGTGLDSDAYYTAIFDMRFEDGWEMPITAVINRKKGEYGTWEIVVTETSTLVRKKE